MNEDEIIRSYLPLVDFLAEAFGPTAEVVLHDFRNKEHSMVAIRNGYVTGRKAGEATATDFALQLARHGEHKGKPYFANYFGKPDGAQKILRSSSYFIRNAENHIIGMLGINIDLTQLWTARQTLDQLLTLGAPGGFQDANTARQIIGESSIDALNGSSSPEEQIPLASPAPGQTIEAMVRSVMEEILANTAVEPSRMTPLEKRELVEELNARGVFLLKGVVTEVAQKLEVSEQTVYRYLKNL